MAISLMANWFLVTMVKSTVGTYATSAMDMDTAVLGARLVSCPQVKRPRSRRKTVGRSCPRPDVVATEVVVPDANNPVEEATPTL